MTLRNAKNHQSAFFHVWQWNADSRTGRFRVAVSRVFRTARKPDTLTPKPAALHAQNIEEADQAPARLTLLFHKFTGI